MLRSGMPMNHEPNVSLELGALIRVSRVRAQCIRAPPWALPSALFLLLPSVLPYRSSPLCWPWTSPPFPVQQHLSPTVLAPERLCSQPDHPHHQGCLRLLLLSLRPHLLPAHPTLAWLRQSTLLVRERHFPAIASHGTQLGRGCVGKGNTLSLLVSM